MSEIIRPADLPAAASVGSGDVVPIDNGSTVRKATMAQVVASGFPIASQSEAVAGLSNNTAMTPLRTKQAMESGIPALMQPWVDQAQAWAESSTPPNPGIPDSKSAKSWAGIAESAAAALSSVVFRDPITIITSAGQKTYALKFDPKGDKMTVTLNGQVLEYGNDYTLNGATITLATDGDLEGSRLVYIAGVATPYFFNAPEAPLYGSDFGMFPGDTIESSPVQTTPITNALESAKNSGRKLVLSEGYYRMGSTRQISLNGRTIQIEGLSGGAIFTGTQNVANNGGMLLDIGGTNLLATVRTVTRIIRSGDGKVQLSSVSGINPGMFIGITSSVMWYYDARDIWRKGDMHRVTRVIEATNEVEIEGAFWDHYDPSVETLTVNVGIPNRHVINNIGVEMPVPSTDVSMSGLSISYGNRSEISNISVKGLTSAGLTISRCMDPVVNSVWCDKIGRSASLGYGVSVQYGEGALLTNINGTNLRRMIDFNGISGSNGGPARRGLVDAFKFDGGGTDPYGLPFYPDGGAVSAGVGTHGPSEDITFANGSISNCMQGITVRGLNTTIRGVKFFGPMRTCVYATYGNGLSVFDCEYTKVDYGVPPRQDRPTIGPRAIVELGGEGVTAPFGHWNCDLPTVVRGFNTVGGIGDFVRVNAVKDDKLRRLVMDGINFKSRGGNTEGYLINSFYKTTTADPILFSGIRVNDVDIQTITGNHNVKFMSPGLVPEANLGNNSFNVIGEGNYIIRLAKDTRQRFRLPIFRPYLSVRMFIDTPQTSANVILSPTTTPNLAEWNVGADVSLLTANDPSVTSSPDGKVSLAVTNNSELWVVNRLNRPDGAGGNNPVTINMRIE